MRRFLLFAIIAALGVLYLWQQNNETAPAPNERSSLTTPAPHARQVYEHDWAKHSIDRAREVAGRVRKQTQDAQSP